MRCVNCGDSDTRVIDSRIHGDGYAVRRRRQCSHCSFRFTTYEQVAETSVVVIKKDASRTPFDREKIRYGIAKACYKRPVSTESIETVLGRIEAKILATGETEMQSDQIGEMVMNELKALDQVAYVRFASVYRNFKDVTDFEEEIRPLLSHKQKG